MARDPILKERLFGLTNSEGNHGEDVKECYYYLDATPTHSLSEGTLQVSAVADPYAQLVEVNRSRGRISPSSNYWIQASSTGPLLRCGG